MVQRAFVFGPAAALAASVALGPVPASGQAPASVPSAAVTNQAQPYLAMAGQADVYEITSSQIALMRSQNPAIRQFATRLIDHHTRTTNAALAAAKTARVTPPPPALDAQHRAMIGQLLSAPAAQFDQAYLQQQVPAHETALALHSGYAANGDTPALRATAQTAVPIVTAHLQQARSLRSGGM